MGRFAKARVLGVQETLRHRRHQGHGILDAALEGAATSRRVTAATCLDTSERVYLHEFHLCSAA